MALGCGGIQTSFLISRVAPEDVLDASKQFYSCVCVCVCLLCSNINNVIDANNNNNNIHNNNNNNTIKK